MTSRFGRLKQIYMGFIPIYPLGYVILHGFRGDQIWAKPYLDRSSMEPSGHLKELVEQEIDKMEKLKKFQVVLTDEMEPKVYGALFLSSGAELQFPLRMTLDDVETARRIGANLEVDLGLSKHRRKVEVNSETGDELIARLMLSDAAKHFIVQRQLQIANSGEYFCAPILAWLGLSTMGYGVLNTTAMIVGPYIATATAVVFTIAAFSEFSRRFESFKITQADQDTISRGDEYTIGAIDYLESTMKLNRLYRKVSYNDFRIIRPSFQVLGEEGERKIARNGDLVDDLVKHSTRIKEIRKLRKQMKQKQSIHSEELDD
ncbi:Protein CBG16527 [Caenorhabditis briggsae]|uniref:Protein CBG16527 n=1 Tax=Caenorhabditis briggsae TaxID=6238 RepID=A8XPE9_CAEBR|nr:Protein CBG16527 [Caenorhabditis briggsae]CAP34470.2 Protein CBG16527 [Caenorhabditis briggsae]